MLASNASASSSSSSLVCHNDQPQEVALREREAFHSAAKRGQWSVVCVMLSQRPEWANLLRPLSVMHTPLLHYAVETDAPPHVLQFLVDAVLCDVTVTDRLGFTAFDAACRVHQRTGSTTDAASSASAAAAAAPAAAAGSSSAISRASSQVKWMLLDPSRRLALGPHRVNGVFTPERQIASAPTHGLCKLYAASADAADTSVPVIVKVFSSRKLRDSVGEFANRFPRTFVRALSTLTLGTLEHALVLEHMGGGSLERALANERVIVGTALPLVHVVAFAAQITRALESLHQAHVTLVYFTCADLLLDVDLAYVKFSARCTIRERPRHKLKKSDRKELERLQHATASSHNSEFIPPELRTATTQSSLGLLGASDMFSFGRVLLQMLGNCSSSTPPGTSQVFDQLHRLALRCTSHSPSDRPTASQAYAVLTTVQRTGAAPPRAGLAWSSDVLAVVAKDLARRQNSESLRCAGGLACAQRANLVHDAAYVHVAAELAHAGSASKAEFGAPPPCPLGVRCPRASAFVDSGRHSAATLERPHWAHMLAFFHPYDEAAERTKAALLGAKFVPASASFNPMALVDTASAPEHGDHMQRPPGVLDLVLRADSAPTLSLPKSPVSLATRAAAVAFDCDGGGAGELSFALPSLLSVRACSSSMRSLVLLSPRITTPAELLRDVLHADDGPVVGTGGFGQVRRVSHATLPGGLALKVSKRTDSTLNEASILAELSALTPSHPNLVRTYRVALDTEHMYTLMELAGDTDLCAYVTARGGLSECDAANVLGQVCDALHYLHSHGFVHRDVKPDNLLYQQHTRSVKLCDFGFAASCAPGELLVDFPGTLSYAPPEVVRGWPHDGRLRDAWSTGVTGFVLLCAAFPFGGHVPVVARRNICERPVPFERHPSLSALARSWLSAALEKEPHKRAAVETLRRHAFLVGASLHATPRHLLRTTAAAAAAVQ